VTPPSVVLRERARQDVDEAVAHYLDRAGSEVAIEFTDRLEQAFGHIADSPASGSPRYGHEVNLPGLRSWRLGSYPYLVFYMAAAGHIDVWRVLHERRDIPAWLRAP
jgi:toxin ParE1/3/4